VPQIRGTDGSALALPRLESCAICLEGEKPGGDLVTLLCSHTFHGTCLSKYQDMWHCPVCRYSQTAEPSNQCDKCDVRENLWMCLICGNLACGRPQWHGGTNVIQSQGHALRHYEETGHSFAQQLDSQRVWDYRGDRYSARLLVGDDVDSGAGGSGVDHPGAAFAGSPGRKLVEVPGPDGVEELTQIEAQEALSLEYTHLLTTHLEAQRRNYEEVLAQIPRRCQALIHKTEHNVRCAVINNEDLAGRVDSLDEELADARERLARLRAETDKARKGHEEEQARVAGFEGAQAKRQESLRAVQQECEHATASNAARIRELEEEMACLMQNLD